MALPTAGRHLLSCPARSPSRWRAKSCSLLVATAPLTLRRCGVPQSTPSARLTNSPAWQEFAPYSSRRHSQDFGSPRRGSGISQSSTCICLPAEASAQAGAFLSSLKNSFFQTATENGVPWQTCGDSLLTGILRVDNRENEFLKPRLL